MPRPHQPRTYEELTRQTVPMPDSSYRPTLEQEREAYAGMRVMDEDERALYAKICDVLIDLARRDPALDLDEIQVEVERARVAVRGRVPATRWFETIEDAIRAIEGVRDVDNDLVLGASE